MRRPHISRAEPRDPNAMFVDHAEPFEPKPVDGARVSLALWATKSRADELTQLAKNHGMTRVAFLRQAIDYAVANMSAPVDTKGEE